MDAPPFFFLGMLTITLILLAVGGLILVVSTIWLIVLGFQRHWAWGLVLALLQLPGVTSWLVPIETLPRYALGLQIFALVSFAVYVGFLVVAWEEAKRPFFWGLATIPIFFVAVLSLPFAGSPIEKLMTGLRSYGVSPETITRINLASVGGKGFSFGGGETGEPASQAPARPVFQSKLPPPSVAPGLPEPAPPGTFYLLERVTSQSAAGFHAANAGEKVTLLERLPGQKLRVTVGRADFVIKSSQVTDDLGIAREVEKEAFVARGGQL